MENKDSTFPGLIIDPLIYKSSSTFHVCNLNNSWEVTKPFRNLRTLGCSIPSAARVLLMAQWFLNSLVTIGRGV